ncbi:MAG: FAD-dependent oxidoreductase [Anaerolineae bacterium]
MTNDLHALQKINWKRSEPGEASGLLRYLVEGETNYHESLKYFVGRNFRNIFEYFSPKNFAIVVETKRCAKHYDNIGHYFDDPHLKAAFTFQNMYLGVSPFDALATYSLLQYTELCDGVWFPMGGLYRVIESLVGIAETNGVHFVYNAPVRRINVEGRRATSVTLEDGSTLAADVVVANADLPYAYDALLPDRAEADRLARLKYIVRPSCFTGAWIRSTIEQPAITTSLCRAVIVQVSSASSTITRCPISRVSTFTPPRAHRSGCRTRAGQDTLFVLVPTGHLDAATQQAWDVLAFLTQSMW